MDTTLLQRPLRLATVSRDVLGNRNVLCHRRAPIAAMWLDGDWQFDLRATRAAAPSECYVECDWGGARLLVGIGRASLDELASTAMPGPEPARWPMPVLLATLEFAASGLGAAVEDATRKSLRIVSLEQRPDVSGLDACSWHASSQGRELAGELLLDATAGRFLAAALRDRPVVPTGEDWSALPMRLRLIAGWVDLPASALRTLAQRDVVLLDDLLVLTGE